MKTDTAISMASSRAYEASRIVKTTAGSMLKLSGYNSGAAQFVQVHNAASLPADTAIPIITRAIAATDNFDFDIGGQFGVDLSLGIVVCNSSTGPDKTIGGADCWFNVAYK